VPETRPLPLGSLAGPCARRTTPGSSMIPARLRLIAAAELAFIVDPIDGTKNFTANLPLFGVMAGDVIGGSVLRTMPLCKYPEQAHYNGTGDKNNATSWSCSPLDRSLLDVRLNGIEAGLRAIPIARRRATTVISNG